VRPLPTSISGNFPEIGETEGGKSEIGRGEVFAKRIERAVEKLPVASGFSCDSKQASGRYREVTRPYARRAMGSGQSHRIPQTLFPLPGHSCNPYAEQSITSERKSGFAQLDRGNSDRGQKQRRAVRYHRICLDQRYAASANGKTGPLPLSRSKAPTTVNVHRVLTRSSTNRTGLENSGGI
jgi:hypothetical protein